MGRVAAIGACLLAAFWRPLDGIARIDQWHGLLLASVWAIGWRGTTWSRGHGWRWVALWAVPVALLWRDAYGFAWLWMASWWLVCCGAAALSDESQRARQAVRVLAIAQAPFLALEALGHPLWPPVKSVWSPHAVGFAGSLGKPWVLGALCGLCAIWATGWRRIAWVLASGATGSLTGFLPALACLAHRRRSWWRWLVPIAALVWAILSAKGTSRLTIWWSLGTHLWPPVGFAPLRGGGFLDEGLVAELLHWQGYHNAWLELVARFGLWAAPLLAGLSWWVIRWCGGWVALWMATVTMTQSLEAYPVAIWLLVMALLGGRAEQRRTHGVV